MNSEYKVTKFKNGQVENIEDLISIEEPLEISLKYKNNGKWIKSKFVDNNENTRTR